MLYDELQVVIRDMDHRSEVSSKALAASGYQHQQTLTRQCHEEREFLEKQVLEKDKEMKELMERSDRCRTDSQKQVLEKDKEMKELMERSDRCRTDSQSGYLISNSKDQEIRELQKKIAEQDAIIRSYEVCLQCPSQTAFPSNFLGMPGMPPIFLACRECVSIFVVRPGMPGRELGVNERCCLPQPPAPTRLLHARRHQLPVTTVCTPWF